MNAIENRTISLEGPLAAVPMLDHPCVTNATLAARKRAEPDGPQIAGSRAAHVLKIDCDVEIEPRVCRNARPARSVPPASRIAACRPHIRPGQGKDFVEHPPAPIRDLAPDGTIPMES